MVTAIIQTPQRLGVVETVLIWRGAEEAILHPVWFEETKAQSALFGGNPRQLITLRTPST